MRVHCVNYLPLLSLRVFCSSSNLVLTCTVLLQVIVTCASWSISFWRLKFFSNEFQGLSDVFQQIINRWNERSRRFSEIGHASLISSHRVIYSAFNSLCQRTLTFAKLTRTSGSIITRIFRIKKVFKMYSGA